MLDEPGQDRGLNLFSNGCLLFICRPAHVQVSLNVDATPVSMHEARSRRKPLPPCLTVSTPGHSVRSRSARWRKCSALSVSPLVCRDAAGQIVNGRRRRCVVADRSIPLGTRLLFLREGWLGLACPRDLLVHLPRRHQPRSDNHSAKFPVARIESHALSGMMRGLGQLRRFGKVFHRSRDSF